MVPPKFAGKRKFKKIQRVKYLRSRYQSWEMSGQTLCQPLRPSDTGTGWVWVGLFWSRSIQGVLNEETEDTLAVVQWMGAQVHQDNVLLTLRQFPQNCPPPPLVTNASFLFQNSSHHSQVGAHTSIHWWRLGKDSGPGAHYCLVADAPAITAWAVHFPDCRSWLSFPRAGRERTEAPEWQTKSQHGMHFCSSHSIPFRKC